MSEKTETKDKQAEKQEFFKQIKAVQDSIKSQIITAEVHDEKQEQRTTN